jgi:hypothetical protein
MLSPTSTVSAIGNDASAALALRARAVSGYRSVHSFFEAVSTGWQADTSRTGEAEE